jgi:DnaJ-class molecular chaperone
MLIAMAALVCWLGGYAVLCAARPFGTCRRCRGAGEVERFGKPRTCPRCRGHRLRLRVGRHAHNAWRRTYGNGTR